MPDSRSRLNRSRREGGQALIMVILSIIPMLGIMGMVVDLGYMHFLKIAAQTAAEVATKAAVIDMNARVGGALTQCTTTVVCASTATQCPTNITSPQNSLQLGCMYAAQHGFQATGNQNVTYQTGGTNLSGTSATPPSSSGLSNVSYWVQFQVSQTVPQLFSSIFGFANGKVSASASSAVVGSSDCIYALDPAAAQSVNVAGTAELVSACGIFVNSNSSTALACNGHGSSYAYDASAYDVVGGSGCPTANLENAAPHTVSPINDPLAGLPVPATGPYTCTQTNFQVQASSSTTVVPLSPGVYCGGINVKKGTAQFATGQYILVGGGLSTQDTNSIIDASAGVLIYNTYDSTHTFGNVSIVANSSANMKAMTSGTYAGVLYFEDRTATAGTDTFSGGSNSNFTGIIYAKKAALTLFGNPSLSAYTILVANTIYLTGTSYFDNDYSSLTGGMPLHMIAGVQ